MKKLKITLIAIVMLGIMLAPIGRVKASLQANPNTHEKKADLLPNWIRNMRNMEKSGEAMGLNEQLNSDLTAESDSNDIDVHMMKSTEYGAIAILSASGYGNPQKLQESTIKTTTGNKTGMYFTGVNWEYVAAEQWNIFNTDFNPTYYDIYSGDISITKVGDALGTATTENPGCRTWHSSGFGWSLTDGVFFRGGSGIFGVCDYIYPYHWSSYFARGVASCGEGL